MKRAISAVLVLAASFGMTASASAHKSFPPFTNLLLKADLATEQGMGAWQQQIGGGGNLVYIDWHLQNFTKSGLFKGLVPPNGGDERPVRRSRQKPAS